MGNLVRFSHHYRLTQKLIGGCLGLLISFCMANHEAE